MSSSSKFDLSSRSPDRPLFTSGQRGSYSAASLDRSSSFHESMENATLSALPSMTRNSSAVTQGDVTSFLQCLRFDPKSLVVDHKLNRPVGFKRLTNLAVGVPTEDSPVVSSKVKLPPSCSPEELRRLKLVLRESCRTGRERSKVFSESLSVMNNRFPSIPTRKRSRLDALTNDRCNPIFSSDRVPAKDIGKISIGAQGHGASNFEVDHPKSEERPKNAALNKRTRTSVVDPRMDAQAHAPGRPPGNVNRDRDVLRHPNVGAVQGEDHTSSVALDGWEKSKIKKKRTGIKPDIAGSAARAKPNDGYKESRQGMHSRLVADGQAKLGDTHAIRPVIAAGAIGTGKADGNLQLASLSMRSSHSRSEQDNNPVLQDRKDRLPVSEKERTNIRAINNSGRPNPREDLSSGSPTASAKLNGSARAPRSGSGNLPKFSPVVQRASASNDWELSQCSSKLPATVGGNSRKRTASTRSSSPPQWASQRPQKISRTARRNHITVIHSNEPHALDNVVDTGNARRLPDGSPQQAKIKSDHFSPAASESEESGVAETKSRDKSKRSDILDEDAGQSLQKTSALPLPSRKNKAASGNEVGTGFRRQGRTSRGLTSNRSVTPLSFEKPDNVGTAKQLGNARNGIDKIESKTGRPPIRKMSDRKAYNRQKICAVTTPDFLDDGHDELLAAATAVTNTARALSSTFWKQMESFFRFISDDDTTFLKQLECFQANDAKPTELPFQESSSSLISDGVQLNKFGSEADTIKHSQEQFTLGTGTPNNIPLYQRLMAAILPEEGNEQLCFSGTQDPESNVYGSACVWETVVESDGFCNGLTKNYDFSHRATSNGYKINDEGSHFDDPDLVMVDGKNVPIPDSRNTPKYKHSLDISYPEQNMMPGMTRLEYHYNTMSIEERLLLEIHAIGIFPDEVPDLLQSGDEEITEDISKLDEKYHEQVSRKKSLLDKLLNSASAAQKLQEKEFEQHALDKLVEMAYQKFMACRGPSAHGMKSASVKMAKQAASSFVKRTLERCQEFDETGKSCFKDSSYLNLFLSEISRLCDGQGIGSVTDGELGKLNVATPGSAALGQQHGTLSNNGIWSPDMLMSPNQTPCKEETWINKVKKRELPLEDVGGGAFAASSCTPSTIGGSLSSSVKGKRSERDREGNGNSKEAYSRNGNGKFGRPVSTKVKGERKSKAKPRQKTGQLSASVNGLVGKISDGPEPTSTSTTKLRETDVNGAAKAKSDYRLDELEAPIDLSGLQLPEIDDLGGQGQDIGAWFSNIEDDGLPDDDDFMGLEIPMDDLSELNMMV